MHSLLKTFLALGIALTGVQALAHGDVTPQPVDTAALPDLEEDWPEENPYREAGGAVYAKSIEIGASGYNQNCARCHGLEVVSGGLAPDLRYLSADWEGDEWYVERFTNGYSQNGVTKMPAFADLLGAKAAWAIRSYVETRPDDGALDPFADRLGEIRDDLKAKDTALSDDAGYAAVEEDIAALRAELDEIAGQVESGSGAEVADSAASRAVTMLDGTPDGVRKAAETLTIGLSAAE